MRIFSLIAVVLFVSSLGAPARAGMVEDCKQDRDTDLRIDGCKAVIGSGQLQGKELTRADTSAAWWHARTRDPNGRGYLTKSMKTTDQATATAAYTTR